jgi:hypothetical protein
MFGPFFHAKQPNISLHLTVPTQHNAWNDNFEAVFEACDGSRGMLLLKLSASFFHGSILFIEHARAIAVGQWPKPPL